MPMEHRPRIEFRKAAATDIDALAALTRATLNATHRSFLGDETVDDFFSSGACDKYLADEIARCTVMVLDGQIVGYTVWKGNLIDVLMVDCQFHRQGLGSRLLSHSEGSLFAAYSELVLESFEANAPADIFYRKHGWIEARRFFDENMRQTKITFRKPRPR
ncbi:MAG: GNAT family N-acetyltransferase [Phycisphaerae bacterium]|nr:GNAT family N-acetyltransferase [Phycisphaerae bacterium]